MMKSLRSTGSLQALRAFSKSPSRALNHRASVSTERQVASAFSAWVARVAGELSPPLSRTSVPADGEARLLSQIMAAAQALDCFAKWFVE